MSSAHPRPPRRLGIVVDAIARRCNEVGIESERGQLVHGRLRLVSCDAYGEAAGLRVPQAGEGVRIQVVCTYAFAHRWGLHTDLGPHGAVVEPTFDQGAQVGHESEGGGADRAGRCRPAATLIDESLAQVEDHRADAGQAADPHDVADQARCSLISAPRRSRQVVPL